MCILPVSRKHVMCPQFYLNNVKIKHVFSHSYLGFYINSEMCDDDPVKEIIKSLYKREMIKRLFF